jgi:hypothetical protein
LITIRSGGCYKCANCRRAGFVYRSGLTLLFCSGGAMAAAMAPNNMNPASTPQEGQPP